MKILLVDDAEQIRAIQKKVLAALGAVEFIEAADGREALRAYNTTPGGFDLMLIDIDMPHLDGLALARRIRQSDKRTPIIMCTAAAGRERVIEAIRSGVNNYLIKPFSPEALLDRVRQTLSRIKSPAA